MKAPKPIAVKITDPATIRRIQRSADLDKVSPERVALRYVSTSASHGELFKKAHQPLSKQSTFKAVNWVRDASVVTITIMVEGQVAEFLGEQTGTVQSNLCLDVLRYGSEAFDLPRRGATPEQKKEFRLLQQQATHMTLVQRDRGSVREMQIEFPIALWLKVESYAKRLGVAVEGLVRAALHRRAWGILRYKDDSEWDKKYRPKFYTGTLLLSPEESFTVEVWVVPDSNNLQTQRWKSARNKGMKVITRSEFVAQMNDFERQFHCVQPKAGVMANLLHEWVTRGIRDHMKARKGGRKGRVTA